MIHTGLGCSVGACSANHSPSRAAIRTSCDYKLYPLTPGTWDAPTGHFSQFLDIVEIRQYFFRFGFNKNPMNLRPMLYKVGDKPLWVIGWVFGLLNRKWAELLHHWWWLWWHSTIVCHTLDYAAYAFSFVLLFFLGGNFSQKCFPSLWLPGVSQARLGFFFLSYIMNLPLCYCRWVTLVLHGVTFHRRNETQTKTPVSLTVQPCVGSM